jgi:hypothetical protein
MKKYLFLLCCILIASNASGYSFYQSGIYYNYLPDSTLAVTHGTQYNCYSGNVTIPATVHVNGKDYTVTTIDINAFYNNINNYGITQISLPSTIRKIKESAFYNCQRLTQIDLPELIDSIPICTFQSCISLKRVSFPKKLRYIGGQAFLECVNLDSINVPSTVTEICVYAFSYCRSLKTAYVPLGGFCVFRDCPNLKTIHLTEGMTSIAPHAFDGNETASNFILAPTITTIGERAFYGCNRLKSIELPMGMQTIESDAFAYCDSLESIRIPASIKSIGRSAVSNCPSLSTVESPVTICNDEFNRIFNNCPKLTTFIVPNGVSSLQNNMFGSIGTLKKVILPSSVVHIGDYAFARCHNLDSIVLPESLQSIGSCAFDSCSSLTSIRIPSSVKTFSTPYYHLTNSFGACENLETIYTTGNNLPIGLSGCSKLKTIVVPEDTKTLPANAFSQFRLNRKIAVALPSSLERIDTRAFNSVHWLERLVIPESVHKIETYAFNGCDSLTSIVVPNSVDTIGNYAFNGCRSLRSVDLPTSLNYLGAYAFYDCNALKSLRSYSTQPLDISGNPSVFWNVSKTDCILYVPSGSKNAYKLSNQWLDFANIVEFDATTAIVQPQRATNCLFYNPSTRALELSGSNREAVLKVYGINGIVRLDCKMVSGESVSLEALPKGCYVARIETGNNVFNQRFVIQ